MSKRVGKDVTYDKPQTVLMRLAQWQLRRRAGRSRSLRRAIAGAVAVIGGLTMAGGAAFAYFTSNGRGTGSAKAGTLVINVSGTAPTAGGSAVHPFSTPGGSGGMLGGDLNITITNNNGYTLYVDSIQQNGLITASGGTGGTCPSDIGTFPTSMTQGSYSYVGSPTYASYTLPSPIAVLSSSSSQTVTIPNVVGMTNSSPSVCQGATLTIPVKVTLGTS